MKFLRPGPKEQAPAFNFSAILGAQQREAVNRSIAIPGLASSSRDSQKHRFAGFDGDFGRTLPSYLVAAVAVGQQFNDALFSGGTGHRR